MSTSARPCHFGSGRSAFDEQRELAHLHAQLALARLHHRALDADPVAEVEVVERGVTLGADHLLRHEQLHLAGAVAQRRERELPLAADQQEPAGDAHETSVSSPGSERRRTRRAARAIVRSRSKRTGYGSTPGARSFSTLANRRSNSSLPRHAAALAVPLEDDPQAAQGQPRLVVLDRPGERDDQLGQAAGGDHRALPELVLEPVDERVDLPAEPVDRARLDRLDRRLADHVLRRHELDAAQRRRAPEERVHRDLDAGEDRAAEVLTLCADRLDRVRGAEVDDDRRAAVEVVCRDGVGDAVGADLLRVVVEDRHAGADAGLEHERVEAEVALVIWRSAAVTLGTPDAIATPVTCASNEKPWKPRNCWIIERELVRGARRDRRDAPVVGELGAVEEPDDGLGVAGVDREQHGPLPSVEVERDVERRRRVGDRADRDVVDAGLGVRADRLERDPTGHLDRDPAVDERARPRAPAPGSCCRAARGRRRPRPPRRPARACRTRPRRSGPGQRARGPLDRLAEVEVHEVVVLDEHRVRQALAVVEPAAGAHRGLLERAQARAASCGCRGCAALPCAART